MLTGDDTRGLQSPGIPTYRLRRQQIDLQRRAQSFLPFQRHSAIRGRPLPRLHRHIRHEGHQPVAFGSMQHQLNPKVYDIHSGELITV